MIFTKADREQLDRIDQNFLNVINGAKKATLENEEIRRGLIDLDTARFKAITDTLGGLRYDVNQLLLGLGGAELRKVLRSIVESVYVEDAAERQARSPLVKEVAGKENGLKKRVLKRKSGR